MKTIGIVAHSAEGGSLCFITACREGGNALGHFMHPTIVLSAVPMALSMPGWESGNLDAVAEHLTEGVRIVALGGADFYVCPDNTAHIVLDQIAPALPIPGLHIAEVVCAEILRNGWKRVGLIGTEWTMSGPVYARALAARGMERIVPADEVRAEIHRAIFEELCQGVFLPETTKRFVKAIEGLKEQGAECVILGCTEIPLIIDARNSPLPVLDSTRLLAMYAVGAALRDDWQVEGGWLVPPTLDR